MYGIPCRTKIIYYIKCRLKFKWNNIKSKMNLTADITKEYENQMKLNADVAKISNVVELILKDRGLKIYCKVSVTSFTY